MTALAVFVALGLAMFGWQLADDEARAGQALAYLLALVLLAALKGRAGADRLLALVCTFGIWAQAAGLACTAWYAELSSPEVGACDEGTGLPVLLAFGAGLLVVAAEFVATQKGRPR